MSKEEDKKEELKHVKTSLKRCAYKDWLMKEVEKNREARETSETTREPAQKKHKTI